MNADFHPLIENRRLQLRRISWALRTRIYCRGCLAQFSWLFFGFGMVFVWALALHSEAFTWYKFLGHLERTPGTVVSADVTSFNEGGDADSSDSGTPIYEVRYIYAPGNTQQHGVGYCLGAPPAVGTSVMVEYRAGNPAVSRAVGLRSALFAPWAILVIILPGIGLGILIYGWRAGRKLIYLLGCGELATGELTAMRKTNMSINDRLVWVAEFTFATPDGNTHTVTHRTNAPDQPWLDWGSDPSESFALVKATQIEPLGGAWGNWRNEKMERTAQQDAERIAGAKASTPMEAIIYDPGSPEIALVFGDIGKDITVTATEIIDRTPGKVVGLLLLPGLVILGHGGYLVWLLVRYLLG